MQERSISFKAKTHSLLGPPFASTTKTQRYIVLSKRLAILESKTTFADIPFNDRFCVVERWLVRAEKEESEPTCLPNDVLVGDNQPSQQRYTCVVKASCDVVFVQSCPFEYQIKRQAFSTLVEVSQAWCAMAQEGLKLAEQAKSDRLLRADGQGSSTDESEAAAEASISDEGGIEVDYVPHHAPKLQVVTMTPLARLSNALRWQLGSMQGNKPLLEPAAFVWL
ncbi:hypothetical protein MPSEU_000676600 [Mayamaea pseudoterrestris]|nr:hypothetical protein MPSEU_000676600 [Mayamaea pseudoterrestris]